MLHSFLRLTAFTGLLLGAAIASGAQEAPLGDRIGTTLEAEEREYFGLFPTIYAPLPWNLVVRPDSVLLKREGRILRVIPPSDAAQLARLIGTFEYYPSVRDNPNWSANPAFEVYINAETPVPATERASLIRVTTPTESYSGFALYTTDSLLVMAPEVLPQRPDLPGAYTIARSEITGLSRRRAEGWQKWGTLVGLAAGTGLGFAIAPDMDRRSGAGFGALIGLTIGDLTSQEAILGQSSIYLSRLDDLALFNENRPPEFPDASGAVTRATSAPVSVVTASQRKRSHEWVSLGIHGIVGTMETMGDPVSAPEATSILQPQTFREGFLRRNRDDLEVPFRLDVSVRPIKWVRGGVFVGSFTTGDSLRNLAGQEQQLRSVGSIRPYAEAILPLGQTGDQRVEVFAGGGLQSYSARVFHVAPGSVLVGPTGSSVMPRAVVPIQQDTQEEGTAWFYHVGLELHSTRYSSLFIRHSWYPIPTVSIDALRYTYTFLPDVDLRVIEAHEVDFGYREIMFGSRFHF